MSSMRNNVIDTIHNGYCLGLFLWQVPNKYYVHPILNVVEQYPVWGSVMFALSANWSNPPKKLLIEHALRGFNIHTLHVCGRCAFSKARKEKDLLKDDQHLCWQNNDPFEIRMQNYTLKCVKEMLLRQGVTREMVETRIKRLKWSAPVNYAYWVDTPNLRVSGSYQGRFGRSVTPVSDAMLGQGATPDVGLLEEISKNAPPMEEESPLFP